MPATPAPHVSLKRRRRAAGIGLREMARALRISHPYLHDMEQGHRPMSWEIKARYEAVLAKKQPSVGAKAK